MNWEMLSATAALFGTVAGGLGLYVRLTVKSALSDFKAELLETLNGRYMPRGEAELLFKQIERRLKAGGH
jgi:hypothetical protein